VLSHCLSVCRGFLRIRFLVLSGTHRRNRICVPNAYHLRLVSHRSQTALVTGAGGQDAYYLSRRLARNGVRVVGVHAPNRPDVWGQKARLRFFDELIELDLRDTARITQLVSVLKPDFILNFGASAGSLTQQEDPNRLLQVNTGAVAAFLDALRAERSSAVFLQASSSEVFAGGTVTPQGMDTPRVPRTIYGVTKIASDSLVRLYRENHALACYSLILYSHESPLRKASFFSKKIVAMALDVAEGKADRLLIHSPEAMRDWGYAGEYCNTVVDLLLDGRARDLIVGSGVRTTVRQFARLVCGEVGLNYEEVAHEAPLQEGRAADVVAVVADRDAPEFCFKSGVRFDVGRLVKLLVRCERRAREIERNG
jgi:GDPmannose 4,6-dehydratase